MEYMRTRAQRLARLIFFVLPAFLVLFAGLIWAVMGLWNWLLPTIFAVRAITYWQALGLLLLSWILFRGPRGPMMHRGDWAHGMKRRWQKMTPAEREEFIKGLRTRWGGIPEPEVKV
jgi:hypothetical protein